ncbi:MAG TPA: efflux RND transporter permease subunit [Sedimenticola thiotaurini]|uniref:Efflux RND transporter permease subunit n=1 Tax=Sedimenticola thiotaurini TaxID=1543721 RepID=A0A831RJZ0_9GAMM|nr:efflux RND transporter permease subunit [Sedimenticola thiotaurini]
MSLAALAVEKRAITYFATLIIVIGGFFSYFKLGQLEDPEFTIKTAAIVTSYPGASAKQVELEVTDRIETKLQEMSELKNVYSSSRAGLSIIKVDIKNEYWADRLPQVWDNLRKKIRDIEPTLPPGAGKPQVNDDFGYVFGFMMAVTGDGFSYAELEKYVKDIRKELIIVPGVARIDFWGTQDKRVYINLAETQASQLGITLADMQRTLQNQNKVVDAGSVDFQDRRMRISPSGEFTSPQEIADLAIHGSLLNRLRSLLKEKQTRSGDQLVRIRDFATVTEGYIDPPVKLMRYNGQPAIVLAMAPLPGVNAVEMGEAVNARIDELLQNLPVGIDIHPIAWQSTVVKESVNAFMINLAEAILIVLVVLAVTMGLRVGILIGITGLVFPILGTFLVMAMTHVDLQRVSLGALIIAMGMMVDNAIVVVDGFVVRLQQGMDRTRAAVEAASVPAWPLLGATVVACMAFYPIYASSYDTGEYAGSLFTTVATSLLFSWLLSVTITPLMCMRFLPDPKAGSEDDDPYASPFYQRFRRLLGVAIRHRVVFLASLTGLLVLSLWGFRFVPQMYFPDSSRLQFMVDYWLPQGARIEETSARMKLLEQQLLQQEGVVSVSAFIGGGPPRFYLPVDPEDSYASYGQLIVNTDSLESVDRVMAAIKPWAKANMPEAMMRVRKYGVGSFNDWKLEARFSGPAEADPEVLRGLADQGMAILEASPYAIEVRNNWRQRELQLVPEYNQERGRWAGVTREDLAATTRRAYDGIPVGQYREGDDLIPIVVRNPQAERERAAIDLDVLQIIPALSTSSVPVSQVIDGIEAEWVDPLIWRWDRRRAITVQSSVAEGFTATTLRNAVLKDFEAIELPPGYTLEWEGEYNSARESQQALIPGIAPALVIMAFIIVVLFNSFRMPLIIFLVIPFVVIGITFGLLITRAPFGFIALLGAMSLSGMMIKNAVVLLDQVNLNLKEGMTPYRAVVEAAVSRLRPVANAAATTVFGMAPLLQDIFWVSMAVAIMFGLAFGTLLTMVLVPVLYALFYKVPAEDASDEGAEPRAAG